jgi:hypothetical protein
MTSSDTSKVRDGSNFGKVIAFGIATKLSILAIFIASKLG